MKVLDIAMADHASVQVGSDPHVPFAPVVPIEPVKPRHHERVVGVEHEAERRKKKLSETFRDLIAYGFEALPPLPDTSEAVADSWAKLGPAPDIAYDKL